MHIRPWYFRALIGGLLSAAAMAAFAANPAPPTATAEATSEQTAAFKQHVAAFRKTLAKRDLPEANRVWSDEGIHSFDTVDVGIAVNTERGLLVPVVRDIGRASMAEIDVF